MNQQYGQGGGMGGQQSAYAQGGGFSSQQGGSPYGGQGGSYGQSGYGQGGFGQGGMQSGGNYGQGYGGGQGGFGGQQQGWESSQGQRQDLAFNPYTADKDYDLISVLYHALQAAETCSRYRQDAQRQGSQEVAAFMEQVQQQNLQISQRAKELLFKQRQM